MDKRNGNRISKQDKAMNNLFDRFKKRREFRQSEQPRQPECLALKREKKIPPHIVACKVCEGKGEKDGTTCPQCKGSGRVIVSCEVTTYVSAYVPETNKMEVTK